MIPPLKVKLKKSEYIHSVDYFQIPSKKLKKIGVDLEKSIMATDGVNQVHCFMNYLDDSLYVKESAEFLYFHPVSLVKRKKEFFKPKDFEI